jgi:hypothetical protein
VSPADERLAALAAAFAPLECGRLLARLEEGDAAARRAGELAARPRGERLAALAAAMVPGAPPPQALAAVVGPERVAVRRLFAAVVGRTAAAGEPLARARPAALLRRLVLERLERR